MCKVTVWRMRERYAQSTYFPNNLRISSVWNVILRIILYIARCLFFASSFVPTIIINTGTWTFSYFQESYMLLVRRIKPFFIIVTSYQERSTCLCGYVRLLMFGCGWSSLYHCFWSLTWLYHIMYISCCRELCEQIKNFSLKPPFCVPYHEKIYDSISVSHTFNIWELNLILIT